MDLAESSTQRYETAFIVFLESVSRTKQSEVVASHGFTEWSMDIERPVRIRK